MTDEQIKQNAEDWVKPLIGEEDGKYSENDVSLSLMKNAFIAGAHSRDEEIEKLKKALSSAQQAMAELAEMARHPWISVEVDTPKISTKKGSFSSEPVFVRIVSEDGIVYHGIGTYYVRDKSWCIRNERDSVTHWMPIQQIEKGE